MTKRTGADTLRQTMQGRSPPPPPMLWVRVAPYWRPIGARLIFLLVPIDANRAGYLKAVWPGFLGCFFEVWPAPGARESLQKRTQKHPAEGRPEGRFRCLPGSSPAKIRPGRPISGPEALLRKAGRRLPYKRLPAVFGRPRVSSGPPRWPRRAPAGPGGSYPRGGVGAARRSRAETSPLRWV